MAVAGLEIADESEAHASRLPAWLVMISYLELVPAGQLRVFAAESFEYNYNRS